jgi:hypothetical protein
VSIRLITALQAAAFPFRHCTVSNGQGGWIRTNVLLLPRQAGTTGLPYTLMIGLPGRSRTCILRVRNTALVRLSYGKKLAPVAGFEPAAVRLTVGCTHPVRLTGMIGGASGNRTQHVILARDNSAPAAAPNWCPASDSNRPVCDFGQRNHQIC